jgi:hypothetical protein
VTPADLMAPVDEGSLEEMAAQKEESAQTLSLPSAKMAAVVREVSVPGRIFCWPHVLLSEFGIGGSM